MNGFISTYPGWFRLNSVTSIQKSQIVKLVALKGSPADYPRLDISLSNGEIINH